MSEYLIKKLETRDECVEFFNVIFKTYIDTYHHPEKGLTKEMLINNLESKRAEKTEKIYQSIKKEDTSKSWIAKNKENKIVGCLGCSKNIEKKVGGFAIYVLPKYQNKGIGSEMLKEGLKWLSNDMKEISIGVEKFNKNAIELYKKLGFKFTNETEDFIVGEYIGKDWILNMKKKY